MKDYRLPENRVEYFTALYQMNLEHKVMPGLVYLYMPELAKWFGWDDEQKLWFAFLNGMTQNPITSLRMFMEGDMDRVPTSRAHLVVFSDWFNANWDTLQFDTDRRYGKKETVKAIQSYAKTVHEHGGYQTMLYGDTYSDNWKLANSYYSFGRLTTFSYLEYVKIMGFGCDCNDLMFEDLSGSKSHRNGMLLLQGQDNLIWDKRAANGFDGKYADFNKMCGWLTSKADEYLDTCGVAGASRFTLESNLCTFKNHFFGRRYPGIYADMAQERIEWYEQRGFEELVEPLKSIREQHLPEWLRKECSDDKRNINQRAALFPETGVPYRAEYFL